MDIHAADIEIEIEDAPAPTFLLAITFDNMNWLYITMLMRGYWYMWSMHRPLTLNVFKNEDIADEAAY